MKELDLSPVPAPVAVVPVSAWNRASQAALQFACSLSEDVRVLHIEAGEGEQDAKDWQEELSRAATKSGRRPPKLECVNSPYRFVSSPIVQYVKEVQGRAPGRKIAVVIPDLVARKWYQYLLHNYRSTALKGLLLIAGNRQVIMINVPWYIEPAAK